MVGRWLITSVGNFSRDLKEQVALNLARCAIYLFARHCVRGCGAGEGGLARAETC